MRVTLVDCHGTLSDAARECGWAGGDGDDGGGLEVLPYTDVRDVPLTPGTAFVSPANSLGFMDGGIDYVYSRVMFPDLEPVVKRAIAERSGTVSKLGRPFLHVGRALVVEAANRVYVVVAPTMLMPQDVRGTHNAYHATYAALKAAKRGAQGGEMPDGSIERLVFPGMCTGCGLLSAKEAIDQMRRAHDDFAAGRAPAFTHEQILSEQPTWYENTEFFDVPPESVKHR